MNDETLEPKQEINKSKCSVCQGIEIRIQNGFYPDGKNKKWVDESGDLWVGRKCPKCVKLGMKGRMRKLRSERKHQE